MLRTFFNRIKKQSSLARFRSYTTTVKQPNQIVISEMFLRDGLQSYPRSFTVQERFLFFQNLNECGFPTIEFGSMTSPKLLPQMAGSMELWNRIQAYNSHRDTKQTRYTMLFPNQRSVERAVPGSGIRSFGLIMSLSDEFARRNQNTSVLQAYEQVLNTVRYIHAADPTHHIRVYISCSFGSPWEEWTSNQKYILNTIVRNLIVLGTELGYKRNDFDIVLADTTGECTEERVQSVLTDNMLHPYIALHLHTKGDFRDVIDIALDRGIRKFDSSFGGIGGCPYAKTGSSNSLGNISTYPLLKYLERSGYRTGIDLDRLRYLTRTMVLLS